MRIAVIADIHANYQALKAVIDDMKRKKIDSVICLGDIIGKGVNAEKCVRLVRQTCDIVVRGNTDTRFTSDENDFKDNPVEYQRIIFNKSLLSQESIDYLRNLPFSCEFYLSGNLVRLFHATPYSEFGYINDYDTNMVEKMKIFDGTELTESMLTADIAVFGHLHYQSMLKYFNRTMINCGSVGNSATSFYNEKINSSSGEMTNAHYLILEGKYNSMEKGSVSFSFESVPYDIEKELQDNKGVNPDYDDYASELRNAKYRDIQKVRKVIVEQGYQLGDNL